MTTSATNIRDTVYAIMIGENPDAQKFLEAENFNVKNFTVKNFLGMKDRPEGGELVKIVVIDLVQEEMDIKTLGKIQKKVTYFLPWAISMVFSWNDSICKIPREAGTKMCNLKELRAKVEAGNF
jgi:hypothetical protein